MLHGGRTEEIGLTLMKPPAFEYAGAIGKRNQASERWLAPSVSQQGRSSTTPDPPLWLRSNDLKEWQKLRGQGYPGALGRVRTAWGKPRPSPKHVWNAPGSRYALAVAGSLWQGRNSLGGCT